MLGRGRLGFCKSLILVYLFAGHGAWASVQSTDFTVHQEFISVRAVGMGNAFTAVVDDTSAFFYNPAALAWRKDSEFKMALGGGYDTKVTGFYHDIDNANNQPNQTAKVNAYENLLNSDMGKYYSIRAPTLGVYDAWPGWEVAFIPADLSLDMSVHTCVGPCLNVNGYLDSTLAASYAHKLNWAKGHQISWGTTIKAVHRVYAGQELLAEDFANGNHIFQTSDAKEGLTFDADLGTLWTPPVPTFGMFSFLRYMRPTFALVGRNLVDEGFIIKTRFIHGASGDPPNLGRRLDFGSKWELPKLWVFDNHLAVDERDIGDPNWTFRKGFHAGAEFYWTMYHWWRGHWSAGINQGYLSLGVGAKFTWFQFDFATYGEEVGTPAVPQQSRRYLAELAMDF